MLVDSVLTNVRQHRQFCFFLNSVLYFVFFPGKIHNDNIKTWVERNVDLKKSNGGMANKARDICWLLLVPFCPSVYFFYAPSLCLQLKRAMLIYWWYPSDPPVVKCTHTSLPHEWRQFFTLPWCYINCGCVIRPFHLNVACIVHMNQSSSWW